MTITITLRLSPHEVFRTLEALRESRGYVALEVADQIEEQLSALAPDDFNEETS